MVTSRINKSVHYPENKRINKEDENHEASIYELNINNVNVQIVLGVEIYTHLDKNIVYFPIYIIKDDKIESQIGIYEVLGTELSNVLDKAGDLDLENLDSPLLYHFVTIDFLTKYEVEESSTTDEEMEQNHEELNTVPENQNNLDKNQNNHDDDNDEPSEDDQDDTDILILKDDKAYWVSKYLRDSKYAMKDNEGGGDCLFAVIRDGLKDEAVSVASLRKMLADEATQEIFDNYKEHYDMYRKSIAEDNIQLKKRSEEMKKLKSMIKDERDRTKQQAILERGKIITGEFNKIKEESKVSKELLEEYLFMKSIDSLEDFRKVIQTKNYWADTWAISTLERLLDIKLILFSREAFDSGDYDNIIQCGQLNDSILEDRGVFKPTKYILVDYLGWHYVLIKLGEKGAITFEEIPSRIKKMIVNKCMEGHGGVYSLIPKFVAFKNIVDGQSGVEKQTPIEVDDTTDLYDGNIEFQFYSKSVDKPFPGKGRGEKIPEENIKEFIELNKIKDWRKQLSNFWKKEFELDGHKWQSVEHYYQANKFKNSNPEFYLTFTLDLDTELSKDPAMAKAAGGKIGKYNKDIVRDTTIKIDEDFFETGRDKEVMNKAQRAKFTQNEELKDLLISTKNARLMHFNRGNPPMEFTYLMELRKELN